MRYAIVLLVVLSGYHCVNHKKGETDDSRRMKKNTALSIDIDTAMGDTSSISFNLSNVHFFVHYYNNKPQYIRIKRVEKIPPNTLNYRRDKRGVFISLNDSESILSFGSKYLNGNEMINFHLDSLGRMLNVEINNDQYADTPYVIELTELPRKKK